MTLLAVALAGVALLELAAIRLQRRELARLHTALVVSREQLEREAAWLGTMTRGDDVDRAARSGP